MNVSPGVRLGPYEVLSLLGAGGMGEVYRARDTRLGREVAIKVLPAAVVSDGSRLKRFEKEARAASALNHPSIVTIYDIGSSDGQSWIAMELVEGRTLRELLVEGVLPLKRLLPIGTQVAEGLAQAHEAGIVHRDLKPENVMVTKEGRVKILDFGLAKLTQSEDSGGATQAPTVSGGTEPGIVVGTVAYMSPEQALGKPLDFRSDQFSFGSVLYEMATGKKAFARASGPETMTAIIREEPEPLGTLAPRTPAQLRWIVERCLGKEARERYGSTQDLARDLATLRDHLSEATSSAVPAAAGAPRAGVRKKYALAALGILAVAAAAYWTGSWRAEKPDPIYHRLTFRRGRISGARLSSDGQTIVYSAAWDGRPLETFLMRRGASDSRSLGFPGASLLSLSSSAELALGLEWNMPDAINGFGTLARVPLAGGAPREILAEVNQADWSPDGKSLAVVKFREGKRLLEFPIGRVLYEVASPSWGVFLGVRVSPAGDQVAFIEETGDDESICIADANKKKKTLSTGWRRAQGLAWSPKGDEVWFTGSRTGIRERALWGVSLSGRLRLIARVPGSITLQDIGPDGSVLLTRDVVRREMVGLPPGESRERDLTWLGWSWPLGLSRDGQEVFFADQDEENSSIGLYLRKTNGSDAVRIGESVSPSSGLSPDGKWIFTVHRGTGGGPERYELLPTGAGEARPLTIRGFDEAPDARWFPDGEHLLVLGRRKGGNYRDYVVSVAGGDARPVTPEGVWGSVISPDGKSLLCDERGGLYIYPVEGGQPRRVLEKAPYIAIQWSADGRSIYLLEQKNYGRISRLDLASGQVELWKDLQPSDPTGAVGVVALYLTPDARSYVYTYIRYLSDLYLVEGLK